MVLITSGLCKSPCGHFGQGQIGQIENRMSFSAHNNNKILLYIVALFDLRK
jgi:hypothetical protein